jgi:nucleoside-diphosphate-sugar epimerase
VGYHSTKAEAERIVLAAQDHIEAVIIRPTITYGPGDENGMLTRLIDLIARRRFLRISDGHNHVHLTFIDDLTRGLLLAGTHPGAAGKTLILAGPASIAMRDLVQLIEQITAVPVPPFVVPVPLARLLGLILERIYQLGGLTLIPPITRDKVDTLCQHRGFSFAAAERTLGYSPRINYAEGVKRTIEWMIATGHLSL